jgi:AsmA-like protein
MSSVVAPKPRKASLTRSSRVLLWVAVALCVLFSALTLVGYYLSRRLEPFVREHTAAYLRQHFESELSWSGFRLYMPMRSPLRVLLAAGRGAVVVAEADDIVLRYQGRRDIPPLLKMHKLHFAMELRSLLHRPIPVKLVRLDGLELNIPPKGARPELNYQPTQPRQNSLAEETEKTPIATVDEIIADGTRLVILPRGPGKLPLAFNIYQLAMAPPDHEGARAYDAMLLNALPPGLIKTDGKFGPWNSDDPGDTPVSGDYVFRNADLGVFKGIAGILSSIGRFSGELDELSVDGETDTPDFRLRSSGNPVRLRTKFHAIVDGTNGNTWLQPVDGILDRSHFSASGEVVHRPGDPGRTISLNVTMTGGRVEDFLELALKGSKPPFRSSMDLNMKFLLPPGREDLSARLRLLGKFHLHAAEFASQDIQEKIDTLSRRGQGKPKSTDIADVRSDFTGNFSLQQGTISFRDLRFAVPGASVLLDGQYMFKDEALDFHGVLRLQAKVSQTVSGIKRILLIPVDPFFSKDGAGTLLHIKITGTRANPQFGRDK